MEPSALCVKKWLSARISPSIQLLFCLLSIVFCLLNMYSHFNVRVYGLLIANGSILVNDEVIHGRKVRKFPGGGLELGEGTSEGLAREFREELNLEIRVASHFYTTDYFVKSAWDNSQVISIYYLVEAVAGDFQLMNVSPDAEQTVWVPLTDIRPEDFTLPIDKTVAGMIQHMRFPEK